MCDWMAEDLLRRDISEEMKESYINYAMSVISEEPCPMSETASSQCIAEFSGVCTKPVTLTRRDTASPLALWEK